MRKKRWGGKTLATGITLALCIFGSSVTWAANGTYESGQEAATGSNAFYDEGERELPEEKEMIAEIRLSSSELLLKPGMEKRLTASVYPRTVEKNEVMWSSSKPSVASVDEDGVVTAVGAGTAEIYASAADGSGVRSNGCRVTVRGAQIESGLAYPSEEQVRAYYEAHPFSMTRSVTYQTAPSFSPYAAGALSGESRADGLNALNLVRYIAGLPEVGYSGEYEDLAMKAAVVNAKNGEMDHYPSKPDDMPEDFYQDAYEGASHSNLGWSSGARNLAYGVINMWMNDGDSSNIADVGHRRWCLNPAMEETGFGLYKSYSAMYALDGGLTEIEGINYVAWPAGNIPVSVMKGPWSVSFGSLFAVPKKDSIEITISDGRGTTVIDGDHGTMYVSDEGYGFGPCVIFDPGHSYSSGDTVTVTISGLRDSSGNEAEIAYSAVFFDMKTGGSGSSGGSSSGGSGSSGGSSSGGSGSGGGGGSSGSGQRSDTGAGPGTGDSLPSYVIQGNWSQNADGQWSFSDAAGNGFRNAWAAVENPYANAALGQQAFDWFRFDDNGYMVTGWFYDAGDGCWYYLNPISDNTRGRMVTGWQQIDGKYYYFNPLSDGHRGRMYANEVTPDGYYVNADGVWEQK